MKLSNFPQTAASLVAQLVKNLLAMQGKTSGEGNGNPLQHSCLENSMDRGAGLATVPGDLMELDTTVRLTVSLSALKQQEGNGFTWFLLCISSRFRTVNLVIPNPD